jgi:hypothetical protein
MEHISSIRGDFTIFSLASVLGEKCYKVTLENEVGAVNA